VAVAAEVFVDTGAWFGVVHPRDPDHRACVLALKETVQRGSKTVTTNLVLAETHALLLNRVNRFVALRFLQRVRVPRLLVVDSHDELEHRARTDWIERFHDQAFSLADAVSFAVMAERGIEEALTLDRHFRTAGFRTRPAR
jgi:predicted nucleic acid-binding protein